MLNVHENVCKDQATNCLNYNKGMTKQLSLSASSKASMDLISLQHQLQLQQQPMTSQLQLLPQHHTLDETAPHTAAGCPPSVSGSTFFLNKINSSYTNRPRSMDITKYFQVAILFVKLNKKHTHQALPITLIDTFYFVRFFF